MAMALTVELLRARIPFTALAVFLVFALSEHLQLTSVTVKLKTEGCQAPLLTSVVDYDLDSASQETLRMLDNYFTTLRAHSKIEFVALASSEERCERVKQRWGEACRVFHLGEYRWTKQLIGREILAMLRESRRPVVLVDTDVSVGLDPEPLLAKLSCDFGVDFAGGGEANGTSTPAFCSSRLRPSPSRSRLASWTGSTWSDRTSTALSRSTSLIPCPRTRGSRGNPTSDAWMRRRCRLSRTSSRTAPVTP